MAEITPDTPPTPNFGIYISRAVTPRIPIGGLEFRIGADGKATGTARLELQLDTCIHWLEIALEQLAVAKLAHQALLANIAEGSRDFGGLLDKEFKSSVQAIVAAATFFEALYAAVLERMPIKPVVKPASHQKRTARYAVVTEVIRQAFGLKNQGTANLRTCLHDLYRFRDEAVHPASRFAEPVMHPDLQVGVEPRFTTYCYGNAHRAVQIALAYTKLLTLRDLTRRPAEIQAFATYLKAVCEPLYAYWEGEFGPLFDQPPTSPDK